jgi:IPTL-CTERM motif
VPARDRHHHVTSTGEHGDWTNIEVTAMNSARTTRIMTLAALVALGAFSIQASAAWDESVNGDLSGNGLAPTTVPVTSGANHVLGSTGNSGSGVDRDYFKIVVPTGATLDAIMLLDNTNVSGGVSFIGVQAGPQVTVSTTGAGFESFLFYGHYDNGQIGQDLMVNLRPTASGPLPSGTYSFWVQDTGGPATYGLNFVINGSGVSSASVPTLPESGMILLGLLMALAYWRLNAGSRG